MKTLKTLTYLLIFAYTTLYAQKDAILIFHDAQGPWYSGNSQIEAGYLNDGSPVIYVCNSEYRVFKTTDRGLSWSQLNLSFQPTSVACEFSNPNNLYIVSMTSDGIYKSTDGGNSFTFLNNGLPPNFNGTNSKAPFVLISPYDNQTLYFGTGASVSYYTLYVSTNGGQSWSGIKFDTYTNLNAAVSDMVIGPSPRAGNYSIFIASNAGNQTYAGVFVSLNSGASWQRKVNGMSYQTVNCVGIDQTTSEDSPPIIYAGTPVDYNYYPYHSYVYKTTDYGDDWQTVYNSWEDVWAMDAYLSDVYFVSDDSPFGNGVTRSTDYGNSWSAVNNGMPIRNNFAVLKDRYSNYVYTSGYTAMYSSSNKGDQWTDITTGLNKSYTYSVADNNSNILVGNNSIYYKSTNSGANWFATYDNGGIGEVTKICFDNSNPQIAYSTFSDIDLGGFVFKSTDEGSTWFLSYSYSLSNSKTKSKNISQLNRKSKTDLDEGGQMLSVIVDPVNDNYVYACGNINSLNRAVVLRSTDQGASWSTVFYTTGCTNALAIYNNIFSIGDIVYAGGTFGCIKSTDYGQTWTYINSGLSTPVVSLSVTPDNVVFAGTPSGVYRLNSGGRSWTAQNSGLPYTNIKNILANPVYNNNIYVEIYDNTSTYNVYRSTDQGSSWNEWDRGLPGSYIHELNTSSTTPDNIYATTYYGIYYTLSGDFKPLSLNKKLRIPDKFGLEQNYPNPFNPSTNINFEIPKTANVNLRIYDIQGKLVTTLINNEVREPGYYSLQFNGSNISSGIYYYRIEAGSYVNTKKMVLIK